MKDYKQVLCFGDSISSGMDLLQTTNWDETKKLSYPQLLADILGIPCVNASEPGYSNDRSMRLLPELLLKYPKSLVLFNYTNIDRTEFFTKDPDLPQLPIESYVPIGVNFIGNEANNKHMVLNNLYYKHFYEDTYNHNNYRVYNMLFIVQTLCEKYAEDYIQIFIFDKTMADPIYQEEIYNQIDKNHIYKFDFATENIKATDNNCGFGSLLHWNKSKNYPIGKTGHIMHNAHQEFAIMLSEKIKNDF
jgi:hypothetical protein